MGSVFMSSSFSSCRSLTRRVLYEGICIFQVFSFNLSSVSSNQTDGASPQNKHRLTQKHRKVNVQLDDMCGPQAE